MLTVLAWGWMSTAASAAELDGKTYGGVLTSEDQSISNPETIIFVGGKLMSRAAEERGLPAPAYTSGVRPDGVISFEAHAVSETGEKMDWSGEVTGEQASVTVVHTTAQGQATRYTLSGRELN